MAQATETVPVRRIPKQPECNIGTSGHVDHGKCEKISEYVLVDGAPTTGEELYRRVKSKGSLLTTVDGGELYSFEDNEVVSVAKDFSAVRAPSLFYVEHYAGPMYKVSGRTGRSITVTPEHPLLLNRNGTLQWVKAKDIRKGDYTAFLSRVPLNDSVDLPDASQVLKEKYEVVTWDDYQQLKLLTSDFSDLRGLTIAQLNQVRMICGVPISSLWSIGGPTASTYYNALLTGRATPRTRKKIVDALLKKEVVPLGMDEIVVQQKVGNNRPIKRLKELSAVDSDLAKWFAFVWSEGHSTNDFIDVTQTVQAWMLQEFVDITRERMGQQLWRYPGGRYRIYNSAFVDYLRARFSFTPGNETRCSIQSWVCKLPRPLKATFLSWFFTLDGEFDAHTGQIIISQLNETNIAILSYLLHSFGIVPRFSVKKSPTQHGLKTYQRITISGRKDLSQFANMIGFEDKRVQRKLVEYLRRIKPESKETNLSIHIDAQSLRSMFRESGIAREGFNFNPDIPRMKHADWYKAYEGAVRTGRISRTKLMLIVRQVEEQIVKLEESLSESSTSGSWARNHMELAGLPLQFTAQELGYSRKKLMRILDRGSDDELRLLVAFLEEHTQKAIKVVNESLEQLRLLLGSGLDFDQVISLDVEQYDGLVFDLSVPGYGNFIAGKGATVCHNTSLVAAITGVWASAHSEELKRGITIKVGYADAAFYKCPHTPPPEAYSTSPVCPVCGQETQLLRAVSFVDSPGHESLMTNMLAGAAVMDGAILVIAANEPVPMPQTREHMLALQMLGMKKMVVVQNKIDRVDADGARKNYEAIKSFLSGTVAAEAPIIPVSAQHHINIDALIEAIEQSIPTPQRDSSADAQMVVLRSFDVNKPGTEISSLVGGVLGGSVVKGELKIGDEVEISPGLADDRGKYTPLLTRVASLGTGVGMAEKVGPGGLVSVGTFLDPSLTKGDMMVGSLVGKPGSLPSARTHFTADLQLFEQAVGSSEMLKVEKVRPGESLRLNIGTAATLGTVTSARDSIAEMDLRKPVVVEKGSRVALSRRIAERWRLIGSGLVK